MRSRLLIALVVVVGCRNGAGTPAHKAEPPAKVTNPTTEFKLATVTLTEQAEKRLGVLTDEIRLTELQPRRTFGGEMMVPPGQTAVVATPLAGTLSGPENGPVPSVGGQLEKGQVVFRLTPLLTPEREVLQPVERVNVAQTKTDLAAAVIDADRQAESAKISQAAAQLAYDRAQQLLSNKAGSQRSVDEANAQLQLAREALSGAEARQRLLAKVTLDENAGQLSVRAVTSPLAGVLQRIEAVPGEIVPSGKTLFQVVQLNPVWVRVPVYAGLDHDIDPEQPATVTDLGLAKDASVRIGRPVPAPPTADVVAMTVDRYYELDNQDARLRPGQRVSVSLALKGNQKRLTAPASAILYDIHGGTWMYELTEIRTYTRRRVQVDYVADGQAVLAVGPPVGTKIVREAAAELFGTEFGLSK